MRRRPSESGRRRRVARTWSRPFWKSSSTWLQPDRAMAERIHEIVRATAPDLEPRTWYGSPCTARAASSVASSRTRRSSRTRCILDVRIPTTRPTSIRATCGRSCIRWRKLTAVDERRFAGLVEESGEARTQLAVRPRPGVPSASLQRGSPQPRRLPEPGRVTSNALSQGPLGSRP